MRKGGGAEGWGCGRVGVRKGGGVVFGDGGVNNLNLIILANSIPVW